MKINYPKTSTIEEISAILEGMDKELTLDDVKDIIARLKLICDSKCNIFKNAQIDAINAGDKELAKVLMRDVAVFANMEIAYDVCLILLYNIVDKEKHKKSNKK